MDPLVTTAGDLMVGLGEPLAEIIHFEFQSSAAAWKHADLIAYNVLLFRYYHVPVHTVVVLLRPEAAHANMSGAIAYAARPGRGKMDFSYEVVRLWERPAEELLAADLGVTPLAMLSRLPEGLELEEGLNAVARRLVERVTREARPDQAVEMLTANADRSGCLNEEKGHAKNETEARAVVVGCGEWSDSRGVDPS